MGNRIIVLGQGQKEISLIESVWGENVDFELN